MQFRDVIGQDDVKQQLRLSVQEGRIPHAQLFTGPSGAGKLPLALAYAQYLACPNRTFEDSCGVCPTCLQYKQLQHPDLHFAFPIIKPKDNSGEVICNDFMDKWREQILSQPYFDMDDWNQRLGTESKQGIIYEKESSEIIRKLSLKSFGDGYKTMLIWQPEKMHANCANKLLKLIEEPPEKTLFLLVSEQPELLLSTIVSRTQEVRVHRLSEEVIANHLPNLSDQQRADIAHIANGSYLAAIKFTIQKQENQTYFKDFVALMRNAWLVGQKKEYNALSQLRTWSLEIADAKVGREKQKAFLQYAQRQIRENYIYNFHQREMNYQTEEERTFSQRFAPFIHDGNVEKIMDELARAEMQIAQNGNAKIIFFDLCLQMIVCLKK